MTPRGSLTSLPQLTIFYHLHACRVGAVSEEVLCVFITNLTTSCQEGLKTVKSHLMTTHERDISLTDGPHFLHCAIMMMIVFFQKVENSKTSIVVENVAI